MSKGISQVTAAEISLVTAVLDDSWIGFGA
jgi:hypothetical protein